MGVLEQHSTQIVFDLIRGPKAQQEMNDLLSRGFRSPAGSSYLDDFPIWSEAGGAKTLRVGAYFGNKLVATAGARLGTLNVSGGSPLRVGLIGAVATDPGWRGQGLASKTVGFATRWASEQDAAVLALWGAEHDLYRRLGFELCGLQARASVKDCLDGAQAEHVAPLVREGWTDDLVRLMRNRAGGLKLEMTDAAWLGAHVNTRWIWAEVGGIPTAYLALGRGIDLKGIIHEWGGRARDLSVLLARVAAENADVTVLGPVEGLERLGAPTASLTREYLCMARVVDPVRVFAAFRPDVGVSATRSVGGWRISIGEEAPVLLSEGELSKFLFGPEAMDGILSRWLPLPLWFWGLDAV